tara:strand:- start:2213 stop:2599 length:387 start_codon:yes stop_codon:yes gene_type:complete
MTKSIQEVYEVIDYLKVNDAFAEGGTIHTFVSMKWREAERLAGWDEAMEEWQSNFSFDAEFVTANGTVIEEPYDGYCDKDALLESMAQRFADDPVRFLVDLDEECVFADHFYPLGIWESLVDEISWSD